MTNRSRFMIGMLLLALPISLMAQEPKAQIDRTPKISGFVQGLYQLKANKDLSELESNTLRMRRVRMSVDGKLSNKVSYKIQGDWVSSPILVDAYLKYKACPAFAVQVGQFKTPFTMESPINPVNLEVFDYGETVKALCGYDDVCGVGKIGRDIGVMATGDLFNVEMDNQRFSLVNYSIGIFNGNGINGIDNNNRKDVVGRLEFHPWLRGLTLSGSLYYGKYSNEGLDYTRNRYSYGFQYNDHDIMIRAEYVNGETGKAVSHDDETLEEIFSENLFYSNGYYAVAGYWFHFGTDGYPQRLMPVVRYEYLTKDAALDDNGTAYYTVGINYWPLKNVNFKFDYSYIQGSHDSNRIAAILSYKF